MKKRLGEILLERRLIDVDQLNSALGHQRQWGMRLGTALVAKGFIAEGTLMHVLSESLGIPMVDLSRVQVDPKALALVPARVAEQYEVFPLAVKEQKGGRRALLVAMADPLNVTAIDELAFMSDCTVTPTIAQISSIDHAIQRYYHGQKRDIAPLNFQNGLAQANAYRPIGVDAAETTIPGARAPLSVAPASQTQPPTTTPFMDYSDEGEPAAAAPVVMGVSLVDNRSLPPDDPYAGQPTGAFALARSDEGAPLELETMVLDAVANPVDLEAIEGIERKFWALMRVLTRRGLVTKAEFLNELGELDKS